MILFALLRDPLGGGSGSHFGCLVESGGGQEPPCGRQFSRSASAPTQSALSPRDGFFRSDRASLSRSIEQPKNGVMK